MELWYDN